MSSRSQFLPRASVLEKLTDSNRGEVLDYHLRKLEDEIAGIKSGYAATHHKGRAHQLRLANARMRRLVKLAQSFGYWLDEEDSTKTAA